MPIERALPPPIMAFPDGAVVRNLPANAGDMGLIPGSGRSPGGGNDNPFQYSCLENSHGQRSIVGLRPWDHKESDATERLSTHTSRDGLRILPQGHTSRSPSLVGVLCVLEGLDMFCRPALPPKGLQLPFRLCGLG